MPLFLRGRDVTDLLTMHDALTAVEEAFRLHGQGKADNHPRQRPRLGRSVLQVVAGDAGGRQDFERITLFESLDVTASTPRMRSATPPSHTRTILRIL